MVDLSELCISEGKAVWVLYADIVCLTDDGNIFDAALLAFVSAMQNRKHLFPFFSSSCCYGS